MRRLNTLKLYIYVNFIFFILCAAAIHRSGLDAEKYSPKDTLYVSPKSYSDNYTLHLKDATYIEDHKEMAEISFEKIGSAIIDYGVKELSVKAIYTDWAYFNIHHLNFINGDPFTKEYNKDHIAILSDAAAYNLFGSFDCIGKTVKIDNILYEIVGIVKITGDGTDSFIWIPYESAFSKEEYILNLYIKDNDYHKLNSLIKANRYLEFIEKSSGYYTIVDLNQYISNIYARYILLLLLFIIYLLFSSSMQVLSFVGRIKSSLKDFAFSLLSLGIFLFSFNGLYYIFMESIWITTEQFSLKSAIYHLFNVDVLPSKEYLPYQLIEMSNMNILSSIIFCMGLLFLFNFIILNYIDKKMKIPD